MKTYTFDNFVPLQSNRFAFINAVATAAFPEKTGAPLYLYGRPGCGKTHLLHAISHYTHEFHPRIRQLLINANEFIEDFGNTRLGLGTADIRVAVPIDDGSLAAMASKAWRKNSYAFRTKIGILIYC